MPQRVSVCNLNHAWYSDKMLGFVPQLNLQFSDNLERFDPILSPEEIKKSLHSSFIFVLLPFLKKKFPIISPFKSSFTLQNGK